MFGFKRYNYEHFSKDVLLKDVAKSKAGGGPNPGDRAPDFASRTLDGAKVRLSDFAGEKNVLLTFGSATCPFTAASIEGMNEVCEDYDGDDLVCLFVYVREAHPGDRLPPHEDMDDKISAAEFFRDEEEVRMPILLDDLKGTIHKKYGGLPNPTYIIDKSGRIAFRCLWTQPDVIGEALDELLEAQEERDTDHAVVHGGENRAVPMRRALLHTHRALKRGGRQAIRDFHGEMGTAGRAAEIGSRIVGPIALNPGRAVTGALLAGGVIVGALYAGRALRRKRFGARDPYRYTPVNRSGSEGDYAVGI